ncbi:winged helix-turn-helix domain-containing protein [Acidithiobacillus ferriphilus]|uniref:winged helix-turn-helix domain-containing protein n=1 Tax=Acidithiobacillus ferriphilus TaxID=1689834 RepID=UPI00242B694F|nr:helix-turn-helix domain-containing protein [Acidithiobacillus ferriphilus]
MTRPAKRPPDSLLTQICRAITPPRGTGEEAACLNFSIKRLREKIEDDPDVPQYLLTEKGLGYRFADPEA